MRVVVPLANGVEETEAITIIDVLRRGPPRAIPRPGDAAVTLVRFTSPGRGRVGKRPVVRPGSFDLLGLTHYWDVSRNGYWVVKVKTMSARFTRSLKSIRAWCRLHMHDPVAEQSKMLGA